MSLDAFEKEFEKRKKEIEKDLDHRLPTVEEPPSLLHQAMRYSIEAGGKRLRPILACAVADAFSPQVSPVPAGSAIECLHTYSLIHDDLPAMDDSDLRRGRKTCHKEFGEATAILAGDALLTFSFEILSTAYQNNPPLASQLTADLATASGSRQLVGGQMDDILNEGKPITADILAAINRRKTGALIAASCVMGARIGNASEEQISLITQFGETLGESFQVIDDILDFTASEHETGKSSGRDAANDKTTVVTLLGLEKAREKAESLTEKSRHLLAQSQAKSKFLPALIDFMASRNH